MTPNTRNRNAPAVFVQWPLQNLDSGSEISSVAEVTDAESVLRAPTRRELSEWLAARRSFFETAQSDPPSCSPETHPNTMLCGLCERHAAAGEALLEITLRLRKKYSSMLWAVRLDPWLPGAGGRSALQYNHTYLRKLRNTLTTITNSMADIENAVVKLPRDHSQLTTDILLKPGECHLSMQALKEVVDELIVHVEEELQLCDMDA